MVAGEHAESLRLPLAGLMSERDGWSVAETYSRMQGFGMELGSSLQAPFITLSFMALLVIPRLELSDRGLFDAERFAFSPLWG